MRVLKASWDYPDHHCNPAYTTTARSKITLTAILSKKENISLLYQVFPYPCIQLESRCLLYVSVLKRNHHNEGCKNLLAKLFDQALLEELVLFSDTLASAQSELGLS